MKQGKDWKEYTYATASRLLESEGFEQKGDHTQYFTHRTTHHWHHPETTQRASISVENKSGIATISYSMLKSQRAKPRTAAQVHRDNFVLYD
jgi:hypothetical protein